MVVVVVEVVVVSVAGWEWTDGRPVASEVIVLLRLPEAGQLLRLSHARNGAVGPLSSVRALSSCPSHLDRLVIYAGIRHCLRRLTLELPMTIFPPQFTDGAEDLDAIIGASKRWNLGTADHQQIQVWLDDFDKVIQLSPPSCCHDL